MIVKILLSIITGISLTSLLITGALLLVYCVNYFTNYIQGCIAEFRYTKSIDWWQLFLDIITVISVLGTTALISAYMYFQL